MVIFKVVVNEKILFLFSSSKKSKVLNSKVNKHTSSKKEIGYILSMFCYLLQM